MCFFLNEQVGWFYLRVSPFSSSSLHRVLSVYFSGVEYTETAVYSRYYFIVFSLFTCILLRVSGSLGWQEPMWDWWDVETVYGNVCVCVVLVQFHSRTAFFIVSSSDNWTELPRPWCELTICISLLSRVTITTTLPGSASSNARVNLCSSYYSLLIGTALLFIFPDSGKFPIQIRFTSPRLHTN